MTAPQPYAWVRVHPHGWPHWTDDGQTTMCGVRLRERSIHTDEPPEAASACPRCRAYAHAWEYVQSEHPGDPETAKLHFAGIRV